MNILISVKMFGVCVAFVLLASLEARGSTLFHPNQTLDLLGSGFDTTTRRVTDGCLTGQRSVKSHPRMSIRTHFGASLDEFLSEHKGSAGSGLDVWIVGGRAQTDFLIRSTETNR